jgi:AcrR family transcriptional regulator
VTKNVVEGPPSARAYRSPLRERQAAQTREAILLAFADEILDQGIHGLSINASAARAQIAERTVYRYFANIEALVEGLTGYVGERLAEELGERPLLSTDAASTTDEIVAHLPRLYTALDRIGAPAGAVAAITLARGSSVDRRRRRDRLRERLAAEMTHLPDDEANALFETLYTLAGSVSWFMLTREAGVPAEQAGQAAARVMRAVLADLRAERARAQADDDGGSGTSSTGGRA